LTNDDETLILSVNGEIYNHKALRKLCPEGTHFKTQSDCEVILHLVRFPFFTLLLIVLSR
jgi:asparagine synthase (glutamine-hydrolysing)